MVAFAGPEQIDSSEVDGARCTHGRTQAESLEQSRESRCAGWLNDILTASLYRAALFKIFLRKEVEYFRWYQQL